jgi:hypothetical protein
MAEETVNPALTRRHRGLIGILASLLLVLHVLRVEFIRVDWITIVLVGVLLLLPLITSIRRVFEAEIGQEEVEAVRVKVAPELDHPTPTSDDALIALVSQDPRLGLAKVRIDLEEAVKALYELDGLDHPAPKRSRRGLRLMIDHLTTRGVIPKASHPDCGTL